MKRNLLLLFVATALLWSCSSDSEDEPNVEATSLVGTWELIDVKINESTASDPLKFAKGIADVLIEDDCDLWTFTFNADESLVSENKFNYIEVDLNNTGDGLSVPCPTNQDVDATTYSLDGDQLTFADGILSSETITIDLEGNTLTIAGDDLDPNNLSGSELVFSRIN